MANQRTARPLSLLFLGACLLNASTGNALSAEMIAKCPSGKKLEWVKQGGMNQGSTSVFRYGKDILTVKVVNNGADHTAWRSGSTAITLGSVMSGASVSFKGNSEICSYSH